MLDDNEWRELASKKLQVEYENQLKVSKLLDVITEYINNEVENQDKKENMLNESKGIDRNFK